MNDHVRHKPTWPPIPIKLPLDFPKFEGNTREDIGDHVTTFILWCSSHLLNDYVIQLHIFQITITSVEDKWYIELPPNAYDSFLDLAKKFLNHFQLLIWYYFGTKLSSTFRKNKSMHIYDHI